MVERVPVRTTTHLTPPPRTRLDAAHGSRRRLAATYVVSRRTDSAPPRVIRRGPGCAVLCRP